MEGAEAQSSNFERPMPILKQQHQQEWDERPGDLRQILNARRGGNYLKRQRPNRWNTQDHSKLIRISTPAINENESFVQQARRWGGIPCPICYPHGYLTFNEVEHFCFNCYGTAFRPKNKPYSNLMHKHIYPRGFVKSFRGQQGFEIVIPPASPPPSDCLIRNGPPVIGPPQRNQLGLWNAPDQPHWNIPPDNFQGCGKADQRMIQIQEPGVTMYRHR